MCRQIDIAMAEKLGLVSHVQLLGRSTIGDGNRKFDYLSKVTMNILGTCQFLYNACLSTSSFSLFLFLFIYPFFSSSLSALCKQLPPTLTSPLLYTGNELNLVVKVGPGQPILLGMDVMHALQMDLLISVMQYTVDPSRVPLLSFKHLDLGSIMHNLGITESALLSFDKLPPVRDAVLKKEETKAGTLHYAVDLGTTSFSLV